MEDLRARYSSKITGVLGCYDRIVITGTLPELCYAQGMTSYMYQHNIRIFDYTKFVEPYRDELRRNAENIASDNDLKIKFIRSSKLRKESIVTEVLATRGRAPGLVCILSAMEQCSSYKPWHNKNTHKTYLRSTSGKCLHYYFYFIDEILGLCYLRVPTWAPFRLQFYCNGHGWLESKLKENGLRYTIVDNAFDYIEDFEKAQQLSNQLNPKELHRKLDKAASLYCPVLEYFHRTYHWSVMQIEYSTDIIFKEQKTLGNIYNDLVATAIYTVKPENIATFLGHKINGNYKGEMGNNYNIRIEGSRIKHTMGSTSMKMYDKYSKILRIETTSNDISFFKNYRKVEHRDGSEEYKLASMKKGIYSMTSLYKILQSSNNRYIEFISAIEDKTNGRKRLEKISKPVIENERKYSGFNFFNHNDEVLLFAMVKGEFNIYGFQNKNIRHFIPQWSSGKISRICKRLRVHGIIKKSGKTYKYYLTKLGKDTLLTFLKIKELVILPMLNA